MIVNNVMKKNIVLLLCWVGFCLVGNAQNLKVFSKKGHYGLKDEAGNIIVKPKFDDISHDNDEMADFHNGLVKAGNSGKYGFINRKGEWVVKPKYDDYGTKVFSDGVVVVVKKGYDSWVLDTLGNYIFGPSRYKISFNNGLAAVSQIEYLWGYIDKSGKFVIEPQYSSAGDFDDETGLAIVGKKIGNSSEPERWAIINKNNEQLIAFDEIKINKTKENLYFVTKKTFSGNEEISLYDSKVNLLDIVDEIYPSSDGYYLFKSGEKFGIMTVRGKIILAPIMDNCDRLIYIQNPIQKNGRRMFTEPVELFIYPERSWISFKANGKFGAIDRDGNFFIDPFTSEYDSICYTRSHPGEPILARKGNKWGYLSEELKEILPFKYDRAGTFHSAAAYSGQLACVSAYGKYGFIDQTGKIVIPFIYDMAESLGFTPARMDMHA